MTKYYGIIAAAGLSKRFGNTKPKQYALLDGKTVLEQSIEHVLSCQKLEQLAVVLHPQDVDWATLDIAKHPKILTVVGGKTRAESVLNGLQALTHINAEDFVLVHDAARPFVSTQDILSLIEKTKQHNVGGLLATAVTDTIKWSEDGDHVDKTIPRSHLYRALTPQCFRYQKLLDALSKFPDTTDESMAIELMGFRPLLVPGDPKNIKITYPCDLYQE